MQSSEIWTLRNTSTIIFRDNLASVGSAVAFASIYPDSNRSLYNAQFIDNTATIACTLYWLYDPESSSYGEPNGLDDESVIWNNNFAPYGVKYGTQVVEILVSSVYQVNVYNAILSPLVFFESHDYYGEKTVSDNQTILSISIDNYECNGFIGSLSGGTIVTTVDGVASYDELRASCYPEGNISVSFTAEIMEYRLFGLEFPWRYYVKNTSSLNFRSCVSGERLVGADCVACAEGSYLISYDPAIEACSKCPESAYLCEQDQMYLKAGFWRRSDTTSTILSCEYGDACKGGNMTNNMLCNEGYEGALCSVCASNYFYSSDSNMCESCEGSNIYTPTVVTTFCVLFFVMLLAAYRVYLRLNKQSEDGKQSAEAIEDTERAEKDVLLLRVSSWVSKRWEKVQPKLKIFIATFQIVSSCASSFRVEFPESFTEFFEIFKILDFNPIQILPLSCAYSNSFVSYLVVTTLTPIVLSAIIFVVYVLRLAYAKKQLPENTPMYQFYMLNKRLKVQHYTMFLTLTYFILPSVTTTIFQMFQCDNIDPNNEEPDEDNYYLSADYAISCSSSQFQFGVAWAAVMVVVYPVGLPLLYLYELHCKRQQIMHRDDEGAKLSLGGEAVKFLYAAYQPHLWYFEVVETARRLTLTAIISVIKAGSPLQIVCGMMFSFSFLKVYNYFQPYKDIESAILSEIAQYQVYFTFFGALIVQNSLLGESFNPAMGVLLVLVNLSSLIVGLMFEIKAYMVSQEQNKSVQDAHGEKNIEFSEAYTEKRSDENEGNATFDRASGTTLNPLQTK